MKAILSTLLLLAVFGVATAALAQTDGAVKAEAKAEVKPAETPAAGDAKTAETSAAAAAPAPAVAAPAPAAEAPAAEAPAAAAPAAPPAPPAETVAPPAIEVVATSDVPASSGDEAEGGALTARGAGLSSLIFGLDLGLAGALAGLHVGAALTYEPDDGQFGEEPVPYALWGAALATTAIMGPLSYYLGSKIIRKHNPGVEGSLGMRMLGWISFFLYVDLGITGVVLGLTDAMKGTEGGVAFIGVTAALGVMSFIGFAMESLICKNQANELANENAFLGSKRKIALTPMMTPVFTDDSATGAAFGIGGTF